MKTQSLPACQDLSMPARVVRISQLEGRLPSALIKEQPVRLLWRMSMPSVSDFRRTLFSLFLVLVVGALVVARGSAGQTKEAPIVISVDASEAPRRIIHAHLTIPAVPGPLTLYYPKWIPGEH